MNHVQQVSPGLTRIPTGLGNAYLVGDKKNWVLVDTGSPGYEEKISAAARWLFGRRSRPEAILLTHGHFDHAGSAEALADLWDVTVFAHRLELPFIDGRSEYPPPDPTVGGFMAQAIRFIPIPKIDLGDRVQEMPMRRLPGMVGWDVIETPGHTPGHVSFYRKKDGTLIAGDAVTTMNQDSFFDTITRKAQVCRPPEYYTFNWGQAEESVRKLARLRPDVLVAGHGEPMSGSAASEGLARLAEEFAPPEHGRYVREPLISDENGVVYVPPPVPDRYKRTAAAVAIAGLGVSAAVYLGKRSGSRQAA